MDLLQAILAETVRTLLLASPFLLLGLAFAGLLHVLLPTSVIQRWMGRRGLSGVSMAAAIGVPLPVCSCGVVPISVELRRKGASQPASLSFLTTTPESSVDSILFTWALMGPVLAIARPVAAFFTALLGGTLAIAYLPSEATKPPEAEDPEPEAPPHDHSHDDHFHGHSHDHAGDGGHSVSYEDAPAALAAVRAWFRRPKGDTERPNLWRAVFRPAFRYGFGELLDDIAFWLLLGVLLAGVLGAVLPADLAERGLGSGLMPMLLMLIVGVPLYMCASASTPIAAALMAKGISPGAALVFLLAGPATNAATVVLLARTFGRRFVQIYLVSVVAGALIAGLALDALIAVFGWKLTTPLVDAPMSPAFDVIEWASLIILSLFLVLSLWRGSGRQGWLELVQGFEGMLPRGGRGRRWLTLAVAATVLVAYLLSGLRTIPPGSQGYLFRFGSLAAQDLEPGLHFVWEPMERLEVLPTQTARKADVGFKTDLGLLERRRELVRSADADDWHSPVAAMNVNPEQASYLTADEHFVDMSFSAHYRLADPAAFLFGLDHNHDLVELYAEAAARQYLAGHSLEDLLTVGREAIEDGIHQALEQRLQDVGAGVEVMAVRIVDLHPPSGAVFAFRDVSSAREERETRIHRAHEVQARDIPRARGEASRVVADAQSTAEAAVTEAAGRSQAFVAQAESVARERRILEHLLRVEAAERLLPGREKYIIPPGAVGPDVSLWREETPRRDP